MKTNVSKRRKFLAFGVQAISFVGAIGLFRCMDKPMDIVAYGVTAFGLIIIGEVIADIIKDNGKAEVTINGRTFGGEKEND